MHGFSAQFPKCTCTNHVPKELCIHMSSESGFLRESRSKLPLFSRFKSLIWKSFAFTKGKIRLSNQEWVRITFRNGFRNVIRSFVNRPSIAHIRFNFISMIHILPFHTLLQYIKNELPIHKLQGKQFCHKRSLDPHYTMQTDTVLYNDFYRGRNTNLRRKADMRLLMLTDLDQWWRYDIISIGTAITEKRNITPRKLLFVQYIVIFQNYKHPNFIYGIAYPFVTMPFEVRRSFYHQPTDLVILITFWGEKMSWGYNLFKYLTQINFRIWS